MPSSCDELPGRLRDLCTGIGHDGRPNPRPQDVEHWHNKVWKNEYARPTIGAGHRTGQARTTSTTVRAKDVPCTTCSKPRTMSTVILDAATRVANLAGAAVDFVQDGMATTSPEQQAHRLQVCGSCPLNNEGWCDQSKGGCGCKLSLKVIPRSSLCPQGKWFPYHDFHQPLVNPTRNLIFHIYPKVGKEWNWHWHLANIRRVAHLFNGKIVLATVTGPQLAPAAEVKRIADGIPVTDWIIKPNTRLAETETFPEMLAAVQTDDPNTITFRGHCKGVTHRPEQHQQAWARMMWATCMDLPSVEDALASHVMAGALKCHSPISATHTGYGWFYAGTFYWFRNREIFQRNWTNVKPNRYFPEDWPGTIVKNEEAASLCHDFTGGAVFRGTYWQDKAAPQFEQWKAARPDRDGGLE